MLETNATPPLPSPGSEGSLYAAKARGLVTPPGTCPAVAVFGESGCRRCGRRVTTWEGMN